MVHQDPLTYGSPLQAALADGVVLPASADISKCDKRFRFYAQRRLLQHFTNVFDWDWASSQLLCALLCVLLMDCVICTPLGTEVQASQSTGSFRRVHDTNNGDLAFHCFDTSCVAELQSCHQHVRLIRHDLLPQPPWFFGVRIH